MLSPQLIICIFAEMPPVLAQPPVGPIANSLRTNTVVLPLCILFAHLQTDDAARNPYGRRTRRGYHRIDAIFRPA